MWSVLEVRSHSSYAILSSQSSHEPLAICIVGDGYSWPLTRRSHVEKAEAYASIKDKDISKFFWKNIVYQFRIP